MSAAPGGGAPSRQVVVAGAGIAGLTAALAFAARGFSVQLYERAPALEEVGAGLQLSPNATRILRRLGVLDALVPAAVEPEAILLKRASSLATLARVPLGPAAERRWGAPYLVAHRADLQSALLARVARDPDIRLVLGAAVRDVACHARGVTVSLDHGGAVKEVGCRLLVAADGVWSELARRIRPPAACRFTGYTAWRAMLPAGGAADRALAGIRPADAVAAFLHRDFHLVAYPVRAGAATNLVAVTRGAQLSSQWANRMETAPLLAALAGAAEPLRRAVAAAGPWTAWPLFESDWRQPWTEPGGLALIGDAAHAMTPFAAQGAAMAIEDAALLAALVAESPDAVAPALARFEALRRPRLRRVVGRGAFNRFTWHAAGPIALGRDLVLRAMPAARLAADLDWLYGDDATAPADRR